MECELENITIHYEMIGEGRPIILLHGSPLDHRYMEYDMEPFFEHREGWKRIYPDLPGMGKTPGADWITTQDQILDIVVDFIDQVLPGQRFVVVGASYGGYLARGVIYRRSAVIDGLLLTAPGILADFSKRTLPAHITLAEDREVLAEMEPEQAKDLQGFAVALTRKLADYMKANIYPAVEIADHKFLDRLDEHWAFSFDVDNLTQPFPKPALILTGRQDSITGYVDAWGILENYPRGTFVVLDRAGHGLQVEQEALFRALVNEWLDRVEESTRS
jgi:pimeloyl-ACP methyl ester carboxylesterase